jgi:hypothetical protein
LGPYQTTITAFYDKAQSGHHFSQEQLTAQKMACNIKHPDNQGSRSLRKIRNLLPDYIISQSGSSEFKMLGLFRSAAFI